jgi:hypothetical protein
MSIERGVAVTDDGWSASVLIDAGYEPPRARS